MSICFLITTYNRQESCQRLVDSLQGLGHIIVMHDKTDYIINGATNINNPRHLGKEGYWITINTLYKNRPVCKYYFTLPDDFMINEAQVNEAIRTWEMIDDPQKICLSISEGRPNHTCWTEFIARELEHVWLSQWVDMCFLCEGRFFAKLGSIPMLHRHQGRRIRGSSGVGAYISKHLYKKKLNLYQVKEPLITMQPEHNKSQMYDEINQTNMWHRQRPIPKRRTYDSRCLDKRSGR